MRRFFYACCLLFAVQASGQQTLLNGNGAGGFELGQTLSANGWQSIQTGLANQWVVGTAVPGQAGANALYLTGDFASANPNALLSNYTGTDGNSRIAHIYRTLTLPVTDSSMVLRFKWRALQHNGTSQVGGLRVYIDTSNQALPTTSTLSSTAVGGGGATVNTDWATVSFSIPPSYSGLNCRIYVNYALPASLNLSGTVIGPAVDSITIISRPSVFVESAGTGQWGNPTTWVGGQVPLGNDSVRINVGHNVTLAGSLFTGGAGYLQVNGTVSATNGNGLSLQKGMLINNSGILFPTTESSNIALFGGDLLFQPLASANLQNVSISFLGASVLQRFVYTSNSQFGNNALLNTLNVSGLGGVVIPGNPGPLRIHSRINLFGGTLTHNGNVEFVNLQPTVGTNLTGTGLSTGSYATPPPIAAGTRYQVVYSHITTPFQPLVAGSRNEMPSNRNIWRLVVGNVNAHLRLTDTLRLQDSTTALTLNGRLVVDPNTALRLLDAKASVATANNGHVEGNMVFELNGTGLSKTLPLGWNNIRRPLSITGVTANNVKILIGIQDVVSGATLGAGLQRLGGDKMFVVKALRNQLTALSNFTAGYDAVGDRYRLTQALTTRRIALSPLPGGTFNDVTFTANTTSNQFTIQAPSLPDTFYLRLASTNPDGFANYINWTGNAGTVNWDDAANWSTNVVPTCADTLALTGPLFSDINFGNNARCASVYTADGVNLLLGENEKLQVGCNMPTGGNAVMDLNSFLSVGVGADLIVHGGITLRNAGRFTQTGGNITLDPVGNSDTLKQPTLLLGEFPIVNSAGFSLSGGRLTIVDPNGLPSIQWNYNSVSTALASHTTRFGNGISSQRAANFDGFQVLLNNGNLSSWLNLGKVEINGGFAAGRAFEGNGSMACYDLYVAPDGVYRPAGRTLVRHNLTNESLIVFPASGILTFGAPIGATAYTGTADTCRIFNFGNISNNGFVPNIAAAGSGYQVGNILTVLGGVNTVSATLLVTAVNSSGSIISWKMLRNGNYSQNPPTVFSLSGGNGTGALGSVSSYQADGTSFVRTGDVAVLLAAAPGLILNTSMQVSVFQINNTKINLQGNQLSVGYKPTSINQPSASSGSPFFTSGGSVYNGALRVVYNGAGTITLPVGTATTPRPLKLVTAGTDVVAYVARFFPANPSTTGNLPSENGNTINTVNAEGYWTLGRDVLLAQPVNIAAYAGEFFGMNGNIAQNRLLFRTAANQPWTLPGTHVASSNADTVYRNGVSNFSDYQLGVGRIDQTLNTRLLSFSGQQQGYNHLLSWKAVDERATAQYELQAAQGRPENWITLGRQQAGLGSYQQLHNNPAAGIWYYRLRILNRDGIEQYSAVVKLGDAKAPMALLTPNVGRGQTQLSITLTEQSQLTVQVWDLQGKLLQHQSFNFSAGNHLQTLQLNHLPAGIYRVRLRGSGQDIVLSYLKQ